MDKVERFKTQQMLRAQLKGRPLLHKAADTQAVTDMLSGEIDDKRLSQLDYLDELKRPVTVSRAEATQLLEELEEAFYRQRMDELLEKTRGDVLRSVIGPFGLGKLLSAYDKTGGNVTTVHNAQQGIYASTDDEYDRKRQYTHARNSEGKRFAGSGKKSVGSEFTREQMDCENNLVDAYTGEHIAAKETSPDHVVSLSGFHKEGGFMLSDKRKADFATDKDNLASTKRNINQSMGDQDKLEWLENQQNGRNLTNADHFGVQCQRVAERHTKGQQVKEKHLPTNLEKGVYYTRKSLVTGASEGMKMGGQQVFGVVLVELFAGVFEELKSAFVTGLEGGSLLNDISARVHRVARRVMVKWKDVVRSFGEGFVSGLVSNVVTTLINLFVTTGKRVVRMIREGVFSLLRALKMMFFPPEHMSAQQAAHEGLKLMASGGIVVAGVVLEEVIEKALLGVPLLAGFVAMLTPVLVGAVSALGMALACYLLDKLDLFGAVRADRDNFILEHLDRGIQLRLENTSRIIEEIEGFELLPQS